MTCTQLSVSRAKNPFIIGYSFGAWIASMYLKRFSLPCILISPPTAMFEVSFPENKDVWVIASDMDQYSDLSKVRALVPSNGLYICPGIDHFWFGDEGVLTGMLNKSVCRHQRACMTNNGGKYDTF